jgi:mannose-6-phosphate isomerase-like protein (cupin superfamily)
LGNFTLLRGQRVAALDKQFPAVQIRLAMSALHQPFPMLKGRSGQIWRHQPAFTRPAHFHAEPELNLVLRGTAKLRIGRNNFELTTGECAYFHPGVDHALVSASDDLELYVIALKPDLFEKAVGTSTVPRKPVFRTPLSVSSLCEKLGAAEALRDASSVEILVADSFRALFKPGEAASAPVQRVLRAFDSEPHLSEQTLASDIGILASELSRRVHE